MRILHINSYYGSTLFFKNLYDKQQQSGLNIEVFTPISTATVLSSDQLGDYTTVSRSHSKYDRFIFHVKHHKIYNDIINKYNLNKYSVIHAHSLFSNGYIALNIKKNYGIPYIVAVRNTDVNTFFKCMLHLRKLGVEILQKAEKVIFLSEPYKNLVMEKYIPSKFRKAIMEKTEIVPNGIDDFWFGNIVKSKCKVSSNPMDLNLLYVGVVNKNKNITSTVKAIEILLNKGYNIKFTVVGRIEDESVYQLIRDLSFVNYVPPKPKESLIDFYRGHDIFIMPSLTETFGLVYPEAMSQGLPVIYSRGQGFDGQFPEGIVGYSVEPNSFEEIAAKVIEVNNNFRCISDRCITMVGKFKWNSIVQKYSIIYESLARKNRDRLE